MRCKKHDTDLSSIIGICASCLRERLFKILHAHQQPPTHNSNINIPVPTLVRPYNKPTLCHTYSEKRFLNSPQIVFNTGGCKGTTSSLKKHSLIKFPSISNMFRSHSCNEHADSISTNVVVRKQLKQGCVSNRGLSPVGYSDDESSSYGSPELCKQTPMKTVPQLAYAKSFCGNRSRKLADFGRCSENR